MSKFLYFQDFHIYGKNSVHYISDYFEDCLTMLDEILALAKEHKVKALIDGGDLLHSPEPSYRILDEIADRVEKAEIPIFCLFGNHAQRYHSMEHSKYTGLAHLFKRSKYFQYFPDPKSKCYFGDKFCDIQGIEYSHDVEQEIKDNGIQLASDSVKDEPIVKSKWQIAIVHAFICPKEFPYASHVVCDNIKTNADVVLVAHYHAEWEKQVGSTLYRDIGCIGRRSITEKDIKPSILLIDTEKREMKEIFLKSAKDGDEIFDLSKVEESKAKENTINAFIQSIEDVQFQEMSIKDTVKFIAKEKKIDQKPVDLIINKIGELE